MLRQTMESLIAEMLDGRILLDEALAEFEKIYIQQALERTGQHLTKTAAALGVHRNTISKRLAVYENVGKKPGNRVAAISKNSARETREKTRNKSKKAKS
jgi:DNA-binding NtrC family response regulator